MKMFNQVQIKFIFIFSLATLLSACGSATTNPVNLSGLTASQLASGRISQIASLTVTNAATSLVASNTNTCVAAKNEYVSLVKVAIAANSGAPSESVQIQSVQLYSTLNSWETLPVSMSLKQGTDTGWLTLGSYGNRCFSQILVVAQTNSGTATLQVSAFVNH